MQNLPEQIIDNYPELKYALLDIQTFDPNHYGFPELCYKMMETDTVRVGAYHKAFEHYDNLRGATVCEAGVGTMVLTKHFLPYVKKAYLIENNPNLIDFIREEIKKNGWEDKVELIVGDAMKVELPEQVDYLIGELMSIYCANEFQVQIFQHLRQFLKPEGKLIPEKIINLIQLCDADLDDEHKHYPIMFTRHLPTFLSTQQVVNITDLYTEKEIKISAQSQLTTMLAGTANSVFLNSWVQLADGVNFTGSDSLMPPTVVRLEKSKKLKLGESVSLESRYTYGTDLDAATFEISCGDAMHRDTTTTH